MGKHFNNRAVSAVIATLLLIAIAVAAAIVVYVFSMGLLGGLQTSGGQQVKEQLIMEAYNWADTSKPVVLTLRNVGPATVQFADWFIAGAAETPTYTGCTVVGTATTLAVGSSCSVSLTTTGLTVSAGVAYTIKVTTIDGGVFSYSAIGGSTS
jgi:flagellin-like protein